jgi:pyridoxal phosphate enzyme (YggS family)
MIEKLLEGLRQKEVQLVAVSKTRSNEQIMELYNSGQRIFGENRVQELVRKQQELPKDIKWHLIGHLQTNKVKQIAEFIDMIHSVDSKRILQEINKQAEKYKRVIPVLLQIHIAQEEAKFGFDSNEINNILEDIKQDEFPNIKVCGLMGMATYTNDELQVRKEFKSLSDLFDSIKNNDGLDSSFKVRSMGMSGDYEMAIEEGSNMVRIGSLLFR